MLRTRYVLVALIAIGTIAGASWVGHACFVRSPQPVQVWADHIEVDISNSVAVKRYECVFLNPNANAVVGGMCYMEVEPGAQVDNMSLKIGNKVVQGEILDRKKANNVFTDIVRRGGSPALLEYYGNKLIRTRIPRIPARGTVTVNLQYTTVLKKAAGLTRISLLNTNPKAKLQPLKKASVTVTLKSDEPILNVYSPTHDIKVKEAIGEDALKVSWKQENYLPKNPFVMYYATSVKKKIGVNLLTHREPAERGFFMTMIAPTLHGKGDAAIAKTDILEKDVVFCVDTSFSMNENGKMEQARKGLTYCVNNLREGDRFNIVDFSTEARTFKDGLVAFDANSKQQALNYIGDLEASGGTAINEALETSLSQFADDSRLKMVVFMTDGLPTIGERDPKRILAGVKSQNKKDVRLFVFGEGYDVNTRLLDVLAQDNRGDSDYILPKEDIAGRIAKFFDKVGSPVMTDLEVQIEGIKKSDIYPRQLPDLFKGDQVVVYGRYDITGERKLTLTGMVNGEKKTLEYTVNFPKTSDRHDFVPRLWAGQKVSDLMSALRKNGGTNKEMVEEVTSLAKRFGIITPYTAYLVTEDVIRGRGPARPAAGALAKKTAQRLARAEQRGFGGAADASKDDKEAEANDAFKLAATRRVLRKGRADALAGELDEDAGSERARDARAQTMKAMRYIGARTFYQSDGYWFDSRFEAGKAKTTDVAIASEKYFELIAKHRGLTKYLALGKVVLKVGDTWYRFVPRGK